MQCLLKCFGLKRTKANSQQGFVVVVVYSYSMGPQQSLQLCKHGSEMMEILILAVYIIYEFAMILNISMVANDRIQTL